MKRILLLLALSSCSTTYTATSEFGTVSAPSQFQADRVAAELRLRAPQVHHVLGVEGRPARVEVLSADRIADAPAAMTDRQILVGQDSMEGLTLYVAHELVHWNMAGSPYEGVPHFVEEGLADWIAAEVTGIQDIMRKDAEGKVRLNPTHLYLDGVRYCALSGAEREPVSTVGYAVVTNLGLPRLREMARDGATVDEYIEAAGLRVVRGLPQPVQE